MKIEKSDFLKEASNVGLTRKQAEQFWQNLNRSSGRRFDLTNILYYFGALIVILAMGWFAAEGWDRYGGIGILSIALAYILIFVLLGSHLWKQKDLRVPGGLFITMAVSLIPLAAFGLQSWMGLRTADALVQYNDFVSWVKGGWFVMELSTIAGGAMALRYFPFPFLTVPVWIFIWFFSMDLSTLLFGDYNSQLLVSATIGTFIIALSYVIDLKGKKDFAFWGYLFGGAMLWSGLSFLDTKTEFHRFFYLLANIFLVLLSVFLQRTVFLIFGACGIAYYAAHLFYRYFFGSFWFPVLLSAIGLFFISIALIYHRNRKSIDGLILRLIPARLQKWRPIPK